MVEGSLRNHECAAHGGRTVLNLSSFVMRDRENNHIATLCMIRDVTQAKAVQRQIEGHTRRQAALYELNLAATSTLELSAVLQVLLERLEALVPRRRHHRRCFSAGPARQLRKLRLPRYRRNRLESDAVQRNLAPSGSAPQRTG